MKGLAIHVHHDRLVEYCHNYQERVDYIKSHKPLEEVELRLRLFKLIPEDRLPEELNKAWAACDKAWAACDKAYEAYKKASAARAACDKAYEAYKKASAARAACDKAIKDNMDLLEQLHSELCPDCPWDGKTIFPKVKA